MLSTECGYIIKSMRREVLIIIVFVLIALVGLALFFTLKNGPGTNNGSQTTIIPVDNGKVPDYFPAIPISSDVKIVNNYNATSPDGRVQATRTFENRKSVAENFDFYKNYLTAPQNGWTLLSEVNNSADPNHKAIFAKNADGILTINISAGQTPGTSLVDASFLISLKK